MVKDVLSMTATIVILAVGTASAFWDVVLFGHRIIGAQTVAPKPAAKERAAAQVTGTVQAIDKEDRTVTLVGQPGGTLALPVQDPQKLDAVKVGDPVVATYYEALTAAITAVNGKNGMLIKGLDGEAETMKVRDPQILTGIRAGDLVQLTFTPALAVALEKPAGM